MKNHIVVTIIVAVILGAVGFFAGMQYQKSKPVQFGQNGQYMMTNGNGGGLRGGFRGGAGRNGAAVRGQIVSTDNGSITIKLNDGSTKIILFSGSTPITKATQGSTSDLTNGQEVVVFGTPNSDGSVTAQMISLNPGMMRPSGTPVQTNPSPTQ